MCPIPRRISGTTPAGPTRSAALPFRRQGVSEIHALLHRGGPVGVIGAIVPSNAPLMISGWKFAPALAAGNLGAQNARECAASDLHVASLIEEAAVPAGVVNVLPGLGEVPGTAIVTPVDVDMICFTGAPQVGRIIALHATETLKRCVLSLEGKRPRSLWRMRIWTPQSTAPLWGCFFKLAIPAPQAHVSLRTARCPPK